MNLFKPVTLMITTAVVLAGCGGAPTPTQAPGAAPAAPGATQVAWPAFVDRYIEDYFRAHPVFASQQGRHEFDGKFPDWTRAGIEREIARLHAERDAASAYTDAVLTEEQRFEREYLLARIDRDLFALEVSGSPFRNPGFYLGASDGGDSLDPSMYVNRPYASADVRARAFIEYAKSVARVAPDIRANLPESMPATFVKLGVAGFGGYADFYRKDVPLAFASVTDPALKKALAEAIEPAAKAMQGLADWIKSNEGKATGVDALGPEKYAKMLQMTERVDVPVATVEAAGRADMDRNIAALREACRQIAPKATLAACVDKVMADKPEGGAVAGARAQLAGLRQFIIDHDVVSIPGTEVAQVAEAPAYNRQNFAYIEIPGPYEHGLPSTYYIAPPDPSWTKEEQAKYVPGKASLLFTSAHEVWPGHFLQFLHSNRVKSKIGQLWVGYAFAEGWAHYGEELMWEKGLGKGDAATHVGQLTQALMRDARLLCSIGMHTHGMTLADCEKLMIEQGFQNPGQARQQAARGTYDPGYLNYTLGKLMIRKLRSDWTATRGGEKAWKSFHDEFLSYGGPPIPLLRKRMLGADAGPAL